MKEIALRFTVEYRVDVADDQTKDNLEFYFNEGTYCADNLIDDLYTFKLSGGCACVALSAVEVIEVPANPGDLPKLERVKT